MPPRIRLTQCLRALHASPPSTSNASLTALPLRPFSSSTSSQASTVRQPHRYRDPYAVAQSRARKAANISRQEALRLQRAEALGDPVRGNTTSFVQSFDTGRDPEPTAGESKQTHLNHFLSQSEIDAQLETSKNLLMPLPVSSGARNLTRKEQDVLNTKNLERHEKEHQNVQEALKRIVNLDNGSAKDRLRVNIQRCIETFGRHQTDKVLPAKPKAMPIQSSKSIETVKQAEAEVARQGPRQDQIARKGPDTGSSEVQIAILTAKIRSLANFLETRGRKDKVGKRDLRLLVHRRQKLLQYLKKKERGGPRWQRCIETLGLTEGTWKGEISL